MKGLRNEGHVRQSIESSMDRIGRALCLILRSNRRGMVRARAVCWVLAVAFQGISFCLCLRSALYLSIERYGDEG
jgi:hypothetical protein